MAESLKQPIIIPGEILSTPEPTASPENEERFQRESAELEDAQRVVSKQEDGSDIVLAEDKPVSGRLVTQRNIIDSELFWHRRLRNSSDIHDSL